jgi:hypothetical protein
MRGALEALPLETGDQSRHALGRIALKSRDRVRVGVERDRDRAVPEPLGHDLHVNARLQGQRRVRVPEVVQPDDRQVRLADQLPERPRHHVRMKRLALLVREDEAVGTRTTETGSGAFLEYGGPSTRPRSRRRDPPSGGSRASGAATRRQTWLRGGLDAHRLDRGDIRDTVAM